MMKKTPYRLGLLCVTISSIAWSTGATAGLPIGSVAVYSDGRVEKLLSRKDGAQLWEDDRKRRYLRSDNPVMPLLWRRDFLSGGGYRQVLGDGKPGSMRKLPTGERVEFKMNRIRHSGERSSRIWECAFLGSERKTVLGKRRSLDSYACERFVYHRKTWQKQFRESRRFSYSPDLGVVVEMTRKTAKKSSRWALAEIIPPAKATYEVLSRKIRKLRVRD